MVCGVVTGVLTRSADRERVMGIPEASLASLSREVKRSIVHCVIG